MLKDSSILELRVCSKIIEGIEQKRNSRNGHRDRWIIGTYFMSMRIGSAFLAL